ncbi:MAG: hypothetical protein J6S14_04020, partial [Clostridia bacterium]|nr:hypothetical protein [Clostridia bacterium]
MNMKKTVSLLLAFLMILGVMPVGIFAVEAEMQDGLTEATAYQVKTLQELSEKLRDPSATYIDVVNEINEEFTSAENTNGILEIVGTKVLNLYQPVSVTSAGAGQVRSLFHLDSATDNLTVKGGANIFYYSNHTVDGAVVWARNGKFTLESGNLYGRVKSGVAASCHAVLNSGGNVLLQVGELNGYTASRNGQDVWGVVYVEGGTTVLGGTPFGLTVNGSYNESGSFTCKLAGISVYGNATQSVTLKENVTVNKIKDFSIAISTLSTQKVSSIVGAGCSMYQKSGKQMIGTNTTSIAESVRVIKPVTFASFHVEGYRAGSAIDADGKVAGLTVTAPDVIEIGGAYIGTSNDEDNYLKDTILTANTDYWLIVEFSAAGSYDPSLLNAELISLDGVTPVAKEYEAFPGFDLYYAKFKLPQLKATAVDTFTFDLTGYERGAKAGDVQIEASSDIIIDTTITGISDDPEADSLLSGSWALEIGENYYFQVVFSAAAGYDISDLSAEKVHLNGVTPTSITANYTSGVGTIIFGLPKIPREPITSIDLTINGYGSGKTPADVEITEAAAKVTVDDVVFSTDEAGTSEITSSTQFYNNMDIWVSFTVFAAEDKSVAALTKELISISGVRAEIVSAEYNSSYDYLDVKLKLAQIPTPPSIDIDVSGHALGAPITGVAAVLGALADDIEIQSVGIYSDASCDSSYKLTEGNFAGDTDYWMEIVVVSDLPMDMITDSIVQINGVTYTDIAVDYDARYDYLSIRLQLEQIAGTKLEFALGGYAENASASGITATEKGGATKVEIPDDCISLHKSFADAEDYRNIVSGNILSNTDYWLLISMNEVGEFDCSALALGDITITGIEGAEVVKFYYNTYYGYWDMIVKLPRFVDDSKLLEFELGGYLQDGDVEDVTAEEASDEEKITIHTTN